MLQNLQLSEDKQWEVQSDPILGRKRTPAEDAPGLPPEGRTHAQRRKERSLGLRKEKSKKKIINLIDDCG